MNTELGPSLVKITGDDLSRFMLGKLVYIEHPEKGVCEVDYKCIYINTLKQINTEP
ncbi:hypothetical protein [Algibacter sp. L1A34]|uniref:hypothetical protein n=1 Tax=Algibacter sp. L1A34 TaxID=2686365 RepID=UPI00131BD34A|nr:hypothetical protein [Algibacter sp. L1A34]